MPTLNWLNYKCISITNILHVCLAKQAVLIGKFLKIFTIFQLSIIQNKSFLTAPDSQKLLTESFYLIRICQFFWVSQSHLFWSSERYPFILWICLIWIKQMQIQQNFTIKSVKYLTIFWRIFNWLNVAVWISFHYLLFLVNMFAQSMLLEIWLYISYSYMVSVFLLWPSEAVWGSWRV